MPTPETNKIRIVLVDPAEPGNVGSTARAMRNMGFSELWLVPDRSSFEKLRTGQARKLASGADRILDEARCASSLADALAGTSFAVATTARPRARMSVHDVHQLPEVLMPLHQAGEGIALVFGREDKGLSNEELNLCQACVNIPTAAEHYSLNLAQAVLLVLFTLSRDFSPLERPNSRLEDPPAPAEERETMYQQMRAILLEIGYLNEKAPQHIEGELRQLIDRARPTSREVTLLRGIWSQVEWAASQDLSDTQKK